MPKTDSANRKTNEGLILQLIKKKLIYTLRIGHKMFLMNRL